MIGGEFMRNLTQRLGHAGLLTALCVAGSTAFSGSAADVLPLPGISIHADGALTMTNESVASRFQGAPARSIRFDFGLPRTAPERRWQEDAALPISHALWEKDGIRYTQIVLVTDLNDGDRSPAATGSNEVVVLVQLVGENTTDAYVEASAAFMATVQEAPVSLELRDGLVYLLGADPAQPVAAIDVEASGIAQAKGRKLQFSGNMPPGTSGAMTIKIPIRKLEDTDAINRLLDLQFDDEVRRLKRLRAARSR